MATRKIGSRRIVVDGIAYRWRIRKRATYSQADYGHGKLHVAVELAERPGGGAGAVYGPPAPGRLAHRADRAGPPIRRGRVGPGSAGRRVVGVAVGAAVYPFPGQRSSRGKEDRTRNSVYRLHDASGPQRATVALVDSLLSIVHLFTCQSSPSQTTQPPRLPSASPIGPMLPIEKEHWSAGSWGRKLWHQEGSFAKAFLKKA